MKHEKIMQIAEICHETNRAYCKMIGDTSQDAWEQTPDVIQASAVDGVLKHLESDTTPEQSHNLWLEYKRAEGWVYGETKSIENKTHPCMVEYSELPEEQKIKDRLFKAIVDVFK